MSNEGVTPVRPATWPLRLPDDVVAAEVARIRAAVEAAGAASDYGWGHTIDFGPFQQKGFLGSLFLDFVGAIDEWAWWPGRLDGRTVADVGAFTGGVSAIMAHRGAAKVYAVDEMAGHVQQAGVVADAFGLDAIEPIQGSLYVLPDRLGEETLDLIVCAGVLYHCSDMLVAMVALQQMLKPGGTLLLETNAVLDFEHSYANFGRFVAGMWWQPTAACLIDLCKFAGFDEPEVCFYKGSRALLRVAKPAKARIAFRRGMNWHFDNVSDDEKRGRDATAMAPAPMIGAPAPAPARVSAVPSAEPTGRELLGMLTRRGSNSIGRRGKKAGRRVKAALQKVRGPVPRR